MTAVLCGKSASDRNSFQSANWPGLSKDIRYYTCQYFILFANHQIRNQDTTRIGWQACDCTVISILLGICLGMYELTCSLYHLVGDVSKNEQNG